MKLSLRINFILLPVMTLIFALAGFYSYHVQKNLLLTSLSDKLKYEAQYITDDIRKSTTELTVMTDLFLSGVEMSRFLAQRNEQFRVNTIEPQILGAIQDIDLSNGTISSFGLVDGERKERLYFDTSDPFASFSDSEKLHQHFDHINKSIHPTGLSYINPVSYEFSADPDGWLSMYLYRTFSPDLPLSRSSFSDSLELFTAIMKARFNTRELYLEPLKTKFDPMVQLKISPGGKVFEAATEEPGYNLTESGGVIALSGSENFSVSVEVTEPYVDKVLSPYRNAIISLVVNVTLVTFLLLKWLIHRQIIRPVVELTRHVESAKRGDMLELKKLNANNEVALLNNNYYELFRELHRMAKYDHLTGLANRHMFNLSLKREMERARLYSSKCALLYIDIDNFKHINDSYGHHTGDRLLESFSGRLLEILRDNPYMTVINPDQNVARLAGDEFAVFLNGIPSTDAVAKVAKRIVRLCNDGFELDDLCLDVHLSVGISVYPDDGMSADILMKRADTAMYQVKRSGKNGFHFYSQELESEIKYHTIIEKELKDALANDRFYLNFMPIYNCHTGKISGTEVLLRSDSEVLKQCGPAEFIPVAEMSGLIINIDYWVLREAVSRLSELIEEENYQGTMSVNFSAMQLKNNGFVDYVRDLLAEYDVPADRLELEITETCFVSAGSKHVSVLTQLQEIGVSLSLDDFGTGYTAFNQLMDYPVNKLKIDRLFVGSIKESSTDLKPLIDVIAELADLYNLEVVAEGVEKQYQLDYVRRLGCNYAQGFLLSEPLLWDEFVAELRSEKVPLSFSGGNEAYELSYKSTYGSVTISVSNDIVIQHYKGIISTDILDYVLDNMPLCIEQLESNRWGYIAITEKHVEMSDEFQEKMSKLVGFCLENGCVDGVYVVKSETIVKQLQLLRENAGLDGELNDRLFSSLEEAEKRVRRYLSSGESSLAIR